MSEEKIRTDAGTDESLLAAEELEVLTGGTAEAETKSTRESARK